MQCPKCTSKNIKFIQNYFCQDCKFQFTIEPDKKINFPMNIIFARRPKVSFYRKMSV